MRRVLVLLAASAAVLACGPALAGAHQRHHARHHRGHHHARVRHEWFRSGDQSQASGSQEQPAGTVASFANGVLTITLNDGSSVSGQVTNDTNIECNHQREEGNDNDGDDQNRGDDNSGDDNGSSNSGDDNGDQGEDQGDEGQMCSSSSLTPGTSVNEAELRITNAGAIWKEVELITP